MTPSLEVLITFLVYFSSKHMCPLFCNFWKKVLDPNGPYIIRFLTIIRNVRPLVILEFCQLSVVCSASATYTILCRGLKYLLKVRYIILVYPNVARYLISETLCLGSSKTLKSQMISKFCRDKTVSSETKI